MMDWCRPAEYRVRRVVGLSLLDRTCGTCTSPSVCLQRSQYISSTHHYHQKNDYLWENHGHRISSFFKILLHHPPNLCVMIMIIKLLVMMMMVKIVDEEDSYDDSHNPDDDLEGV